MTDFLLKSGMALMLIASVFIAGAFLIFIFFAFIMLAPGLLLYNAGIKNLYNDMTRPDNDNIRTIEGSTARPENEFVGRSRNMLKSAVRKVRNFLNKYAD
jgi:hypothetical protein